ncbi:putative RNA recognition motif domain, nucleotide-binding alpha-beta plait domain superfamily [Helianthus debilis subsp. tardiflorus]
MAERGKDDEWIDVPFNRNRNERNGGKKTERSVTKYFVSNLPTGCTPWEVSDFFGYYGKIVGTYIARKIDKQGNRFGFVSFANVQDAKDLENRMNGVKMGRCILKVNIAKFAAENVGLLNASVQPKTDSENGRFRSDLNPPVFHHQDIKAGFARNLQEGGPSFADLFNETKVATGYAGAEIHYVGGISLLIRLKTHEEAAELLQKQDKWSKWFSVLDLWEGQSFPYEHVAWLNLFGVPLHLADNSVFSEIASQFGSVVQPAQLSIDDGDLSTVCVGVLVGDGKEIKDTVTLKWKNRSFQVWISEVSDVWAPACM